MKKLLQELINRYKFMRELWTYDKNKRGENLWVARDENITDKGE